MPFPFEETIVRSIFDVVNRAAFLKSATVFLGSFLPWIIGIFLIISILASKSFKLKFYYFSLASLSVILSRGIIAEVIQNFACVQRPFEVFNMSPVIDSAFKTGMPSGHMALLTPLALTFLIMNKRQGLIASIAVFLAGFARVAAGVHWISDVLAGIAVGIISFLIIKAILPKKLSDVPANEMDDKSQVV
ncbi:MAG: phosphatase PAP2 family protein [Candidatus Colwellbacteria bacterium]|jgi:undecaprenyl-diphosphatase|nr:phosphatase PAP2 family protein [Candidatus Colwellbacteria bacterium]MDD4818735.1 phosphatase PAP2 family protein [Candidatus Colwellbacteria bacterium]